MFKKNIFFTFVKKNLNFFEKNIKSYKIKVTFNNKIKHLPVVFEKATCSIFSTKGISIILAC